MIYFYNLKNPPKYMYIREINSPDNKNNNKNKYIEK